MSEQSVKAGDFMHYKQWRVTVVRPTYPRHGDARVVVEREGDKQRFTVAVKYLRPVARLAVSAVESGDYAACPYCGAVWPNDMLRDDKRMPQHNFAQFRAPCTGSGQFPVAPTVAQIREWKESQS